MADGFDGMDQLIAALKQLPEELKAEAAKHVQASANGMEADLKQQYARGKTGNLIRGVRQRQRSPLHIQVRSTARHAHLYEFGTVRRFHDNGKSVGAMPAKPTFLPAAVRHRRRMLERLQEMLRRLRVQHMTGSAV